MDITRSDGPDLVPPITGLQSLGPLFDVWVSEANRWDWPEPLRKTAYWSLRLMTAFNTWSGRTSIAGFRFAAFGFLDPETELDGFGVIALASPNISNVPIRDDLEARGPLALEVDGSTFPVVIRRVVESRHAPTVHPTLGTAACWGRSRVSSKPLGPAAVTAKHVVAAGASASIGSVISLSNGGSGSVLDLGPDGIEAALVSTGEAAGNTSLPSMRLVPPWVDVEFRGAASGLHQTKVTAVTDTRGVLGLGSASVPARVFLASYGRHGDSGALVRDQAT